MAAATEITFNFWGRHGSHGLLRRTPHILRPAFCARDSRYAARLITIKQSLILYEVQKQAASRRAGGPHACGSERCQPKKFMATNLAVADSSP